jgi:transcriptional regulator with XRE-family HTH domain
MERSADVMEDILDRRKQIGKQFKTARTTIGFTQDQVSEFLGVDRTMIAKFEAGERSLGMSTLEKSCELFGCELDMMYGDEPYRPLTVAYRTKELEPEDLEVICRLQRMALNLRQIKENRKKVGNEK